MPDYLNIFEPYQRKVAGHEDALTRAVTRVVSLVLTDEHVPVPTNAEGSDRQQILDGVVSYDELAIVIENKPWHGNIWEGQLHVNISKHVKHDPHVACVVWKDIVVCWGQLLDSRHLNSAEVVLIGDFLEYVEQHFPALRPYSRVALCGTNHSRLTLRCKAALVDIAGTEFVKYHQGWGWYIDLPEGQCARKIGLLPEPNHSRPQIVLEIDPADTMGQARRPCIIGDHASKTVAVCDERWRECECDLHVRDTKCCTESASRPTTERVGVHERASERQSAQFVEGASDLGEKGVAEAFARSSVVGGSLVQLGFSQSMKMGGSVIRVALAHHEARRPPVVPSSGQRRARRLAVRPPRSRLADALPPTEHPDSRAGSPPSVHAQPLAV